MVKVHGILTGDRVDFFLVLYNHGDLNVISEKEN